MITISAPEITKNLSMAECISAMEDLYRNEPDAISAQPMRVLSRIDEASLILTMPSYSRRLGRFAVKIVSEYKNNPKNFSLPVQGGAITLIDSKDSRILAILDSAAVTATRTGAVSGLATKLLAKKDASELAIVGSGQQARTQLEATCAMRKIERVRVYSRSYSNAEKFARDASEYCREITVKPCVERKSALKDAEVIILATNSSTPVIDWAEVARGAHIVSIGTLPERRELDVDTIRNSKLYVDVREGVLKEAGDVMQAIESGIVREDCILGDLTDLLLGRCVGRERDEDVTLFKSVGFGLQDVYASSLVYDIVVSKQKGR